jgi:hypothetical protein
VSSVVACPYLFISPCGQNELPLEGDKHLDKYLYNIQQKFEVNLFPEYSEANWKPGGINEGKEHKKKTYSIYDSTNSWRDNVF